MYDTREEREFYRCLVSDASSRALWKIREVLADDTLDDPSCFQRIEAIVKLMEELGHLLWKQARFRIKEGSAESGGASFSKQMNQSQGHRRGDASGDHQPQQNSRHGAAQADIQQ